MEFVEFAKIPRLFREIVVTEKIDGTNASIHIADDFETLSVGSRTKWITPKDDNFGFANWVEKNRTEILKLGPGTHFGEWWGNGIQRGYGLMNGDKRFSLFNTSRWNKDTLPACVGVVPELYRGPFNTDIIKLLINDLKENGSKAAPGFMKAEGIIVFHTAGNLMFKATVEKDDSWKGRGL